MKLRQIQVTKVKDLQRTITRKDSEIRDLKTMFDKLSENENMRDRRSQGGRSLTRDTPAKNMGMFKGLDRSSVSSHNIHYDHRNRRMGSDDIEEMEEHFERTCNFNNKYGHGEGSTMADCFLRFLNTRFSIKA